MNKPISFCFLICFFSVALLIAGRFEQKLLLLCMRQRWRENTFSVKEGCLYQRQGDSKKSKQVMGIAGLQEVSRFDAYMLRIIGLIKRCVDEKGDDLPGLWFEIKSMEGGNTEKVDIESGVTTVGPFTMSVDGTEIISLEKRSAAESTELVMREKTEEGWVVKERKPFLAIQPRRLKKYKALGYFPQEKEIHVFANNNNVEMFKMPQ